MDNFAWVNDLSEQLKKQGQARLASLIDEIPYHQYQGNYAMVDALVPEALASSRSLDIPWLEVYFKHWLCSSRILRQHGESHLADVVSTYELAHQEQNLGCPQSVCLTQDLVATYGNVDGPGWAPERLAACDETLARIDTTWDCHTCLSIERINALGDQGQPREALVFLGHQRQAQEAAGKPASQAFLTPEVNQWLALRDPQKALALLDAAQEEEPDNDSPREQIARLLLRVRALAMAGQTQAAQELLPPYAELGPADPVEWCRAALAICTQSPAYNTPVLGHAFWRTLNHVHTAGSHRMLIDLALAQANLALQRGAVWLAEQALALAQQHLPMLRQDLGAAKQLQAAQDTLAQAGVSALPCPAEELLAWLAEPQGQNLSTEMSVQYLSLAHQALPKDEFIAIQLASVLTDFGCTELARSRVAHMVLAAPQSIPLQNRWFSTCLADQDYPAITEQVQRIRAHLPALATWYEARAAFQQERHNEVGPLVERLLQLDPEAIPAHTLWAQAAMAMKDYDTAVAQRLLALTHMPEPGSKYHWEVLIAATAAQQWAQVRTQARHLKMTLDDADSEDSPVEEDWGYIHLRFEENGRSNDVLAQRTGPATARIAQIASHQETQRMDDWVVFAPTLMEDPPEDPEALENYIHVFSAPFHVLQKGGFGPSYMLDGVHPGEDRLDALRQALDEAGWASWQYSSNSYQLHAMSTPPTPDAAKPDAEDAEDEEGEEGEEGTVLGVYLAVAAQSDVPAHAMAKKISQLCEGLELSWLSLAREAGQPTAWHEALRDRYQL